MGIFGWSLPPGCSTLPGEEYDEEGCTYCGSSLPESPDEGTWPWHGFCDAECALRESIGEARFNDDCVFEAGNESTRTLANRAIDEITKVWRKHVYAENMEDH